MKSSNIILAKSFINKGLYKGLFMVGVFLVIVCLVGVVWAHFNWDEYSTSYQNVLTGRVKEKGWAPTIYGWGIGMIICILFIMFIVWRTVDFKNPSLIVHQNGLTINKEFFKNTFVEWDEIKTIRKKEGVIDSTTIEVKFKDSKEIVSRHKGISKAFLTQNYIKDGGNFLIKKGEDPEVYEALLNFVK